MAASRDLLRGNALIGVILGRGRGRVERESTHVTFVKDTFVAGARTKQLLLNLLNEIPRLRQSGEDSAFKPSSHVQLEPDA